MNVTLYKECVKLRLPANEKHVLRSLVSFGSRGCPEAHPSVSTIARDTGLGTTTVRNCLRSLEAKHVISPRGNTKGGRKSPTTYCIHPENHPDKPNTKVLGLEDGNPTDLEPIPNGFGGNTQHPGVDDGFDGKSSGNKTPTAAVSQEQMEREFLKVWNYYLEAFDKQEILSPSAKKKGLAILTELHKHGAAAENMAFAIDMARHIVKRNPKKAYLANWFTIFGKWDTFVSLQQQYREAENIPSAATWDGAE